MIRKLSLLVGTVFLVLFVAGCNGDYEQEMDSLTNETGTTMAKFSEEIKILGRKFGSASYIQFHGTSTLPDGTVLVTQLFEDDTRLSWWPEDQEVPVNDGEWEFSVNVGGTIAASYLELYGVDPFYFSIWEKGHPETKSFYSFTALPFPDITVRNDPDDSANSSEVVTVSALEFASGSYIRFSGTSTLPYPTVLVSRLLEGDIPLSWWPEEQEVRIKAGHWNFFTKAGDTVAPSDLELSEVETFHFEVWEKWKPETKTVFSFDLLPLLSDSTE